MRNLAGAAAPPPSGAGRRRGTGAPLDSPVTCAIAPLRIAPTRGRFGGRERRPEATSASRCRAPPRNRPFRRVRRRISLAHDQDRRI
jgi:hypothetical protein